MLSYFVPRIKIYGHRLTPVIRPAVKSVTGAAFWREAGGAGRRLNVRRVRLDNDPLGDFDLLPGQVPTTAYSLMPTYEIRWYSVEPRNFYQFVSAREKAMRGEAMASLVLERQQLQDKANKTEEDKQRLDTITKQMNQLGDAGEGYFYAAHNFLGTGATGLTYGLVVADVPLHLRFTNSIRPNRALSFRIKRLDAPKNQGVHELALLMGDDVQLYALVFGRDKEIEWRHYKPMPAARRAALEAQLSEALDAGRLTTEDRKKISELQAQAAVITQGSQTRTNEQNAQLASLKAQEDKIREEKKQIGEIAAQIVEEIEAQLYQDKVAVTQPEYTTIGEAFDVTIEWLRRGGALITIGPNPPFVWWDKTRRKSRHFGTMLRRGANLEIKSTGGQFGFAMGAPVYASQASLYGAPFTLPTNAQANFSFLASCSPSPLEVNGTHYETAPDPSLPGVRVRASVQIVRPPVELPALGIVTGALYQTRLDMFSTGDYAAELHSLDFIVKPQAQGFGPLIYDSEDHKDSAGVAHLIDVQLSAHEGSSMVATCHYRDGLVAGPEGGMIHESGLPPLNLGKRVATVSLIDEATGEETEVVWRGRIEDDSYDGLQSLHETTGTTTPAPGANPPLAPMPNAGSKRVMAVVGVEQVLNKTVEAPVAVDGSRLNDALRLYADLGGLLPEEYQDIPEGDLEGLDPIPLQPVGEVPKVRPDENTTHLEFMRGLVRDYAPDWELTTTRRGLKFSRLEERDRPDLNYSEDAPIESTLRLLRPLTLRQDFSDFCNRVVVIGAEDDTTGLRVHVEASNPFSFDPRFAERSLTFCGEIITEIIGPNEAILNEAQGFTLARRKLSRKGRPPYFGDTSVPYRPDVSEGDKPYIKGRQYIIERIERGQLNSGGGSQTMTLYLRPAADILLPAVPAQGG